MRTKRSFSVLIASVFLVSACAYPPPGPTHPALIGPGKIQAEYFNDDTACTKYATAKVGDPAAYAQQHTGIGAVGGTLGGAASGAAIGGAIGGGKKAGIGAAVGALAGLLGGLGAGSASGQAAYEKAQRQWQAQYGACMYAAGHIVAGYPAPQQANPPPPPPPPAYQPSIGPRPAEAAPCKPSGMYVRTPDGRFVETCEQGR